MQEVYDFLKNAETYYLATMDGDQPRVRPFGSVDIFDGKLYIQTGKVKAVAKQIAANPKVEICAFKGGRWLRLSGELVEDDRREAKKHMLDSYPMLRHMYNEDDGNTLVLYFKNATAVFSSFSEAPKTIRF
ncbi:MAG: pyridoxamine 5'-phosphate oxidase family protein [Spirochaetales bacterium]|nr:pyridoxamine 5'-phosphate oxidase family protein [Spirochaetales bacterium]